MQVAKWGNSLAVRLPAVVVDTLGLKPGDEIEITIANDGAFKVARDTRREKAIAKLRALKTPLPEGFRFDHDDANER